MQKAKVPLYATVTAKHKADKDIEKLLSNKINKQINKSTLTNTDLENKKKETNTLNIEIQSLISKKKEHKEKEVVTRIASNPKVFYQYATENKKTKSKIGPLISGKTYESDPKKLANILSDQYKISILQTQR